MARQISQTTMMRLMQIIILSCKQATFYSSIKNFKKINLIRRIQLKLHLLMCDSCHEFDHQSNIIDQSLVNFSKTNQIISEKNLSEEKKSQIKATVNQHLNQE
ncbi:MAG: hypothetical protein GQ525_09005 [Draconibacterium sp.]|nr:hypothetical protein [Draconibacterium sp.]